MSWLCPWPNEVLTETQTDVPADEPTDVPTDEPTDVPTESETDVPTETETDEAFCQIDMQKYDSFKVRHHSQCKLTLIICTRFIAALVSASFVALLVASFQWVDEYSIARPSCVETA